MSQSHKGNYSAVHHLLSVSNLLLSVHVAVLSLLQNKFPDCLGNLMTDCTERILSWQADSYSVNKEIARRLLTPKLIT